MQHHLTPAALPNADSATSPFAPATPTRRKNKFARCRQHTTQELQRTTTTLQVLHRNRTSEAAAHAQMCITPLCSSVRLKTYASIPGIDLRLRRHQYNPYIVGRRSVANHADSSPRQLHIVEGKLVATRIVARRQICSILTTCGDTRHSVWARPCGCVGSVASDRSGMNYARQSATSQSRQYWQSARCFGVLLHRFAQPSATDF